MIALFYVGWALVFVTVITLAIVFNNKVHEPPYGSTEFTQDEIQQIFDSRVLWNNLLTYRVDKQLGFRGRENPTPNSATLEELLQILEQEPLYAFQNISRAELEHVKNLSRTDYYVMLERVSSAMRRERSLEKGERR